MQSVGTLMPPISTVAKSKLNSDVLSFLLGWERVFVAELFLSSLQALSEPLHVSEIIFLHV